jgi:D-3-phosphoglycerate dehydrogenase
MSDGVILVTDQVFGDFSYEKELARKEGLEMVMAKEKTAGAIVQAGEPTKVKAIYNTYFGPIDGELMSKFPNLKGIVRCGIGVDTIDLAAAKARNIFVANVPDYCIEEVASHGVAMFLSLARKLKFADLQVRRGSWAIPPIKPMMSLSEYTCGVVGMGRIGRKAAQMLQPMVKRVMYYDPVGNCELYDKVSLEQIYAEADAIFLHLPLMDSTKGMVGKDAFLKMKKKPILINVSRGGLVVTDDLVTAIREERIAGAGLDIADGVVEGVVDHPLLKFENVILTPHSAWYSEQAMVKLRENSIAEAIRMARGERPKNRVKS